MNLPQAPAKYSQDDQSRVRDDIRKEFARTRRKGADLELATGERLILTDVVTGLRYRVEISSGSLVVAAL